LDELDGFQTESAESTEPTTESGEYENLPFGRRIFFFENKKCDSHYNTSKDI
jgi:hypothetical protein